MTQPLSPASLAELRRRMHLDWADGAVDGGPPLEDLDRAANLYGIVADPYHDCAFGNLSRLHLMLICIYGLLENRQWDKAVRAIARLDRMERDRDHDRAKRNPLTGNIPPAQAPEPKPAPPASPAAPSEPPAPAAPPPRAVKNTLPAQRFEVCADRLDRSPADHRKELDTAAPFT